MLTEQIFQSFDMRPHNPQYQLRIKQTLTVKPDEFFMNVTPRKGRDADMILGKGAEREKEQAARMGQSTMRTGGEGNRKVDLSVYYGM
jgi:cytochrome P450/NADPH-cytochrome P450 reductase